MPLTQNWAFFALLSAGFASLTAILGKIGVRGVDSNFANLIRTAAALTAIAAIVFSLRQWKPATVSGYTLLFLILSGVATGMSWLCYYHALKIGQAGNVAVVDKFSVVLVIILAAVFLQEKITWRLGVAGVLITAGMLIIAWPTGEKKADGPGARPQAVSQNDSGGPGAGTRP